MKISVIVPAFNEEKILPTSLEAIRRAAGAFEGTAEWELIVCDNNSSDRTAEIARAAGRKLFPNQSTRYRARETVARRLPQEIGSSLLMRIPFRHETYLPAPCNKCSIQFARAAAASCASTKQKGFSHCFCMAGILSVESRAGRRVHSVFCDAGLFRELGGFSEHLFASEEIDFCRRLKRLARTRLRRLKIITDARLVTSARKMHLYTKSEHLWFLLKAALRPGRILTNREQCALWYNGRR